MPSVFERDTTLQDNIDSVLGFIKQSQADNIASQTQAVETYLKQVELENKREEARIANVNAIANLTRAFTDAGGVMSEIDREAIRKQLGGLLTFDIGQPKGKADLEAELIKIRERGKIEKEIKAQEAAAAEGLQAKRDLAADERQKRGLGFATAKEGLTPAQIKGGQQATKELDTVSAARPGQALASGKLGFWKKYNISTDEVINLVGSEAFDEVHPELGITLDQAFVNLDEALNTYKKKEDKEKVVERFISAYPKLESLFRK